MIKLIASDIDGTILPNGEKAISPKIFEQIKKLRERGIYFIVSSGRQYANMRTLFEPVKDEVFYICENGGVAVKDGKLLYEDKLDKRIIREVIDTVLTKEGVEFTCSTKDFYYIIPKSEEYVGLMTEIVGDNFKIVESVDDMKESCMKIAIFEKEGTTEEVISYWKDKFGDRCTVVTAGYNWVDIIPKTTNKGKGVKYYQELLNIKPEECMSFGDEFNDLEMLSAVKYGFAMEGSKPKVLESANYVTNSVEKILDNVIKNKGEYKED